MWLSLRRPGGFVLAVLLTGSVTLGWSPPFLSVKDVRPHFQILASGGTGGVNFLIGFAGERVNGSVYRMLT